MVTAVTRNRCFIPHIRWSRYFHKNNKKKQKSFVVWRKMPIFARNKF